jgi:hypothetical protein
LKQDKARRAPLRIAGRVLGGIVLLAVLAVAGGVFAVKRAQSVLQGLLDDFATNTVREKSEGAYRLAVGRVKLHWALRSVAIDSAILTTDSAVNAARPEPLPITRIGLFACRVSGVSLRKVILGQGLSARRFGCEVVTVAVDVPRRTPVPPAEEVVADVTSPDSLPPPSFLTMQQGLKLPASAPRIRIRNIDFPHTSFVLRRPLARGGETSLMLEHLEWKITDLLIDPDEPLAATRPLFARAVTLGADNFTLHPDSTTALEVGKLRVRLTDSVVTVADIRFGPTVTDAVFARQRPHRRSRLRMEVGRLTANGVDFGKLFRKGGVYVRHLDVDSFSFDIWSDKRLPKNPNPRPRKTPQAWLADGPGAYGIDSLTANGRVLYKERREGHDSTGVLSFNRIRAVARNIHHDEGRSTYADPMRLDATAWLMNAGRLDAHFLVPLDAPRFTMDFWGTLGAMPAQALNGFVAHALPARIASGEVDGIEFKAQVRGGVARGTITPRYRGLSIDITGRGASGIIGGGGTLARIVRNVVTGIANDFKIRNNNPGRPGEPPRTAAIDHPFVRTETLPAFIWASLRDGLMGVIKK